MMRHSRRRRPRRGEPASEVRREERVEWPGGQHPYITRSLDAEAQLQRALAELNAALPPDVPAFTPPTPEECAILDRAYREMMAEIDAELRAQVERWALALFGPTPIVRPPDDDPEGP